MTPTDLRTRLLAVSETQGIVDGDLNQYAVDFVTALIEDVCELREACEKVRAKTDPTGMFSTEAFHFANKALAASDERMKRVMGEM